MNESEYTVKGSSFDGEEWIKLFCADEAAAWEIAEGLLIFSDYDEIQIWQGDQILHNNEEVMKILDGETQIFVLDLEKIFSALCQQL
jgi:hypothetical protein